MKKLIAFILLTATLFAQSGPTAVGGGLPIATQAEAEAGEVNNKGMTPQRTKQAITAIAAQVSVLPVTQASHGFVVGDVVYKNSPTTYAKAVASSLNSSLVYGVVSAVTSANTFSITRNGDITLSGLSAGVYYLSDVTPGQLTQTAPTAETSYLIPVLRAQSATVGEVKIAWPWSLVKVLFTDIESAPAKTIQMNNQNSPAYARPISYAAFLDEVLPGGLGDPTKFLGGDFQWRVPAGTGGFSAPTSVAALNIDFSAVGQLGVATKTLSANSTFTFSSLGSNVGKTVLVMVSNPSTYTVTWPGVIIWDNASTPTQTTGKTDLYQFIVVDASTVLARRIYSNMTVDTIAPTVVSSTVSTDGLSLTLVFDEVVSAGAGGSGGLTVTPSGGAATLTYSSGAGTNTLVFTISRTIVSGETLTHSYTQPGNGFEDAVGNDLASFSTVSVTNSSTASNYWLSEGAEGGTRPTNWGSYNSNTGVWNYTPALVGTYSVSLIGPTKGERYTLPSSGQKTSSWFYVRGKFPGQSTNPCFTLTGAGTQFQLEFRTDRVRMTHGGVTADSLGAVSTTNEMEMWIEYIAETTPGVSADGVARLYIRKSSVTGIRPSVSATITTGTGDYFSSVYYIATSASTAVIDKMTGSDTALGDNP